jgi:hypothetical protein
VVLTKTFPLVPWDLEKFSHVEKAGDKKKDTGKIHRFDRRVLDSTSTTASNKVGLEDVMLVVCIGSKNINGS